MSFEDLMRQLPSNEFGGYKSTALTTVRLREHRTANRLADEEINLHQTASKLPTKLQLCVRAKDDPSGRLNPDAHVG